MSMAVLICYSRSAFAQSDTATSSSADRPFVPGGYDDKPYVHGLFGRISIGGYLEIVSQAQREEGATAEAGTEIRRWNLLTFTRVSDLASVWAEVEFEDGGQEIKLELAMLDLEFHRKLGLRAGMLLLPLGRFNLAHDGPSNEFTDRPLLATDLVGTALSMPGIGLFGRVGDDDRHRLTYEVEAVNGFNEGLIDDSPDGTRLPTGRANFEDNNAEPSWVGRVAYSPNPSHELGLSGMTGTYNTFEADGMVTDERRYVSMATLDLRARTFMLEWNGEATLIEVDIPNGLTGIYASRQAGYFLETRWVFGRGWVASLPSSSASVAVRAEGIDFDRDVEGDFARQLTLGLHFRITPETVLKLDYRRGATYDRFNNPTNHAAIQLGLTSYF